MTHEPRHGLPLMSRPEFIMSMALPWIGDSAYMLWTKAMSSAQVPRLGKRSLTHFPDLPYCLNFQRGSTMRPSLRLPPRPKVFTGTVLPSMPTIFGL